MAADGDTSPPPVVEEAGHGRRETTGADEPLLELRAVMRRLRTDCAWKAAQTHESLSRYLVEELHETLEAIDALADGGSPDHLREELGDLLLQVYFHAVVAEQAGTFTLDDVARGITAKLVARNPHVFGPDGSPRPTDPAAVNELWEQAKAQEKQRTSVTDGIPPALPALLLADKVLDRLGRAAGAPVAPPTPTGPDDVGARLLAVVADAHAAGLDPETELRRAVRRLLDSA